jgi:hypothetical protein
MRLPGTVFSELGGDGGVNPGMARGGRSRRQAGGSSLKEGSRCVGGRSE